MRTSGRSTVTNSNNASRTLETDRRRRSRPSSTRGCRKTCGRAFATTRPSSLSVAIERQRAAHGERRARARLRRSHHAAAAAIALNRRERAPTPPAADGDSTNRRARRRKASAHKTNTVGRPSSPPPPSPKRLERLQSSRRGSRARPALISPRSPFEPPESNNKRRLTTTMKPIYS